MIGCYGPETEETIHWLEFDSQKEKLTKISSVLGIENPSFIIVNHKKTHLYAVSEVDAGEVVSYQIDNKNKTLRELNRQPTKGGPCFLEIDESDSYLFTANYGGGSIIVHPIAEDGKIGMYSDFHDYISPTGSPAHAHAIKHVPNSSLYVVTDLGLDALYIYDFSYENGKLNLVNELQTERHAGPRHIAFHEDLNVMYVLNQNNSTMNVYSYNINKQTFESIQIVPTLLDPFDQINYTSDIHISICKRYVYVSNRGHHSITVYIVLVDGRLDPIGNTSSGGEWPRNFAVVPNGKHIITANEHTNNLKIMNISQDGTLKNSESSLSVSKPVCVHFF